MATGKFRIKTSNDWNTIFYRFKHSNLFDIECSIGMQIPNKRWSESKQEVLATTDVNYKEINNKLKELNGKSGQIDHLFPEQIDHRFRLKLTT